VKKPSDEENSEETEYSTIALSLYIWNSEENSENIEAKYAIRKQKWLMCDKIKWRLISEEKQRKTNEAEKLGREKNKRAEYDENKWEVAINI